MKYRIGHSVGVYKVDMSVLRVGDVIDDRDELVEFELVGRVSIPTVAFEVRIIHVANFNYSVGQILTWDGSKFIGESKNMSVV